MIGPMTKRTHLLTLVVALFVAGAAARGAHASLFFLFNPTHTAPGDKVVIRTGGTPTSFKVGDRVRPFQAPITLYLVPNAVAASVRSRTDPRLTRIGTLLPDKNGHGTLTFHVPRLHAGTYATAAWCPGCASYSFGHRFFTYPDDPQIVPRYRTLMFLRIESGGLAVQWWWIVAVGGAVAVAVGTFLIRRRAAR